MAIFSIISSQFIHYDLVCNFFASTSNPKIYYLQKKLDHKEGLKVTEPKILSFFMYL